MTYQAPPVVKLSESLLVEIERVVRAFPRYHKYTVGAELRADARKVEFDREQLVTWQAAIARFLAERLQLRLKEEKKLEQLGAGIDFLGYIVRPTHLIVRRRVVQHAREKLGAWERAHGRRSG
jgi:hypothetical protein